MRSKAHSSPSRHRRKAAPIIIGSLATLVVIFVVLSGRLGTGRHSSQDQNTTTTMSLSDIQDTYEAVLSEYEVALASSNAVIATAAADITTQEARIQIDAKNYQYNASGSGCSGNQSDFETCLTDEQQTAQAALADENAATRAAKTGVTKQLQSVQPYRNRDHKLRATARRHQLAVLRLTGDVKPDARSERREEYICASRGRLCRQQVHLRR